MSPGPLARLGAWLEHLLLGDNAATYRQFVRAVVVATVLLLAVNALIAVDVLALGAGATAVLQTAAAVAVALFVLAGLIQVVVLARAYERGTEEVVETAADLETAAADVAKTAEELETAAEDVETAADEVETVVPADPDSVDAPGGEGGPPVDPETVPDEAVERVTDAKERAESIKSQTEAAKETASEVEETAAERRERLAGKEAAGPEAENETNVDDRDAPDDEA